MPSLTQTEAAERARLLTVHGYTIDLDLTTGAETFGSTSTIRFACADPAAGTFVELRGVPRSATLNGRALDLSGYRDNRLPLTGPAGLAGPGEVNELVVAAAMTYSRTGEGLHRFVDPADGQVYLYAQSCVEEAQRIFACFDQPDLKAPVTLSVTAPPDWTVVANGAGTRVGPDRWEFSTTQPIATYLFTVCAGGYHSVYAQHDGISLGWHCRRSLAAALDRDTDELFTLTRQCLDWYQRTFRMRYPFGDTYDQVLVPEFNAGAMENPGCVTFRDEFAFRSAVTDSDRELRAMVVAHEMAHMWFGDLVTLRWWNDMWLNESFAEYLGFRVAAEATRFSDAWASFASTRKMAGYMADQAPSTHPIAGEAPTAGHARLLIDPISYPKGASVLRQLAAFIGDEAFLTGLRTHFERHAHGNATLADLVGAMSEATGRDLTGWFDRWLRTCQVDVLRPEVRIGPDGRYAAVSVRQEVPAGYPAPRPHRFRIGLYDRDGDAVLRRKTIPVTIDPLAHDGPGVEVAELVGEPAADLLLLNDEDLTFARIRFDERSRAQLAQTLPGLTDPLSRALVWLAAWDMTRSGDWAPESYVELVAAALPTEPQLATVDRLFQVCRRIVAGQYVLPERRDWALGRLAAAAHELLDRAEPGSQHRLSAAQALAGCATGPADRALLADWLAGRRIPDGVPMDAELRWQVLRRLVELGEAGPDRIDAELRRDSTAQGEVHAIGCRAALPDAAAKDRAWTAMTTDRTLSNRHLEALAGGFWQPGQEELTDRYVPRYFTDVPASASWRTAEMVGLLGLAGYPQYAVSADTAAAAEKLLSRDDLTPLLRRAVVDRLHETRLALAARAASAAHRPAGTGPDGLSGGGTGRAAR